MGAGSYSCVEITQISGIVNPGGCDKPSLFPIKPSSTPGLGAFGGSGCFRRSLGGGGGCVSMATSPASRSPPRKNLKTSNHLRHVDSMSIPPSGAGKLSKLNAIVLGEALASEEDDLVFPSPDFSSQALVSSPEKVFQIPNFLSFCFSFSL